MTTETATIVFTDLVGSTALLSALGEDRFETLRVAHFAALRRALAAHKGDEVKNLGDGIMAAFTSAADALSAAVAMQQQIDLVDRAWPDADIRIRVGVAIGDTTREEGDYFGTPVVEAARLCAKAADGQILLTELVRLLAGSRGGHEIRSVGALELKGLPEPVAAGELVWTPLLTAPAEGTLAIPFPPRLERRQRRGTFVGRDDEMGRLEQAMKDASLSRRQVVAVRGEPGIGKTRLTLELCRRAHDDGAIVLYGHCDEEGGGYQPFGEAIAHLVEHLPDSVVEAHVELHGDAVATLAPSIRARLGVETSRTSSDPESERLQMFDAAADLLRTAASDSTLVLVLDDLHWASKPTVVMLRDLVERLDDASLLVVATYRDTDIGREHPFAALLADLRRVDGVERISLGGLSDDAVVALVESVAGQELDDDGVELARAIRSETMGSPFFTIELLRHLEETGAVDMIDGRWVILDATITLPESVRDVVGRRVDRLGDDARAVLTAASVIGRDFSIDVVMRVVELDENRVLDAVDGAVAAGLLTELSDDRFAFTNALVRTTLSDELTGLRRRRLHRSIAEALESMAASGVKVSPAEMANHWLAVVQAADVDRAIRYAMLAAERATAELAYEEAASYYERALGVIDEAAGAETEVHIDALLGLARAKRSHGDPTYREPLERAIEYARRRSDPTRFAAATLAWSRNLFWAGGTQVDEGYVAMLDEALASIGASDDVTRSRLLAQLGVELTWHDDTSLRRRYCDEAVDLARRTGSDGAVLDALLARTTALNGPGDLAGRIADADEAVVLAGRLGDRSNEFRASYLRTMAALEQGDGARFETGVVALQASARALRSSQYLWLADLSTKCRDLLHCEADEEGLAACYAIGEQSGNDDAFSGYSIQLWMLRLDRGGLDELVDLVAMNIEAFPQVHAWRVAYLSMTGCLERFDDARAALVVLADYDYALPPNSVWLSATMEIGRIAVLLGELDVAATVLALLQPFAGQVAVTANSMSLGAADRSIGIILRALDRIDESVAALESAVAIDRAIGGKAMLARSQIELAESLQRRNAAGDAERANALLDEAAAVVESVPLVYEQPRLARLRS